MVEKEKKTLNYADIQRIYRLEKNSTSLQKIPENFFSEIKDLYPQINDEHKSYIKKLVSEIYEKRKAKILINAIKSDELNELPKNLTDVEITLYCGILKLLEDYEKEFVENKQYIKKEVSSSDNSSHLGNAPSMEKTHDYFSDKEKYLKNENEEYGDEMIKIRILHSLPGIVGSNSISYGPYSENEEVVLPKAIARVLIDKKAATEI